MRKKNRIFIWIVVYLVWLLIFSTLAVAINNVSEIKSEKTKKVNLKDDKLIRDKLDNYELTNTKLNKVESYAERNEVTLNKIKFIDSFKQGIMSYKTSGNLNENDSLIKMAPTTLYSQNFDNGGSLPSGWATQSNGPDVNPWEMKLDSGSDYRAEANSDEAPGSANIKEWLAMTSSIDCSGYMNLQIQFYLDYNYWDGNENASVLYATSATYPMFYYAQVWDSGDVIGTQYVDISEADGDSEVHIAFIYCGTDDWWMRVDDVILTGESIPPTLQYCSHIIDDDSSGGSSGDDDAIAEPGETIELPIVLENVGVVGITEVYADLSTTDPLITITDNQESYPDIPPGSTGQCTYNYDFSINPSHSSGYIPFTLEIYSNEGSWTNTFYVYIPGSPKSWTIIQYIDGDNNLDFYLEPPTSVSDSNVDVLVLDDGDSDVDTYAYHILSGSNIRLPLSNMHSSWTREVNMGDPNTLIYFSQYCLDRYPSEHYMIVLSNHGGAYVGSCWDDSSGGECLDISDLKTAFSSIDSYLGRNIDVLHFIACLMCTTDIAAQLYPYTDYVVGSETAAWTETWGNGDNIIDAIKATPSITPQSLSIEIVNLATLVDDPISITSSVSAIDCSKISNLQNDINDLANELINMFSIYETEIEIARSFSYDFEGPYGGQYDRLIDLYDFAENIYNQVPNITIQTCASNIMNDLGPDGGSIGYVIVKQRDSSSAAFCRGLSIYFPLVNMYYDISYTTANDFCSETMWDEFLEIYLDIPDVPPSSEDDDDDGGDGNDKGDDDNNIEKPFNLLEFFLSPIGLIILGTSSSAGAASVVSYIIVRKRKIRRSKRTL